MPKKPTKKEIIASTIFIVTVVIVYFSLAWAYKSKIDPREALWISMFAGIVFYYHYKKSLLALIVAVCSGVGTFVVVELNSNIPVLLNVLISFISVTIGYYLLQYIIKLQKYKKAQQKSRRI